MPLLAESIHNLPRNVPQILVCGSPRKWSNNFPTPSPASTHMEVQQEKKALVWLRRPILLSLSRGWVSFGMMPGLSPSLSSIPWSSSYKPERLWSNRSHGVHANLVPGILQDLLFFCIGGMKSFHEARSESSHVWKWRFKNKSRGEERTLFYWTLIACQYLCSVPHTFSFIPHHNPQGIIIFLIPGRSY